MLSLSELATGDAGVLPLPLSFPPIMDSFVALTLDAVAPSLSVITFSFPRGGMFHHETLDLSMIENCDESLQVIINKWYTASNKVVESITPPLEGINIPIAGTVIKDSPFKEKSDKIGGLLTCADIDRVVEQNNYSNQILHVISRQIEDTKPTISGRPTPGINIPIAGTVIKASPFEEKSDKTGGLLTSADIDRVVEQNNYSNQIIHVISRQI
uniref:Uncharacterized protein n=1 Tax=Solanum tuberosum TaxID=4113 RepID=M1CU17_SOLTU